MSCRRHRRTIFPYTTLFRSGAVDDPGALLELGDLCRADQPFRLRPAGGVDRQKVAPRQEGVQVVHLLDADLADRKSTRLNSSHRCTSYAVFCLKVDEGFAKR